MSYPIADTRANARAYVAATEALATGKVTDGDFGMFHRLIGLTLQFGHDQGELIMSLRELAKRIGLHRNTVLKRLKGLSKVKLIAVDNARKAIGWHSFLRISIAEMCPVYGERLRHSIFLPSGTQNVPASGTQFKPASGTQNVPALTKYSPSEKKENEKRLKNGSLRSEYLPEEGEDCGSLRSHGDEGGGNAAGAAAFSDGIAKSMPKVGTSPRLVESLVNQIQELQGRKMPALWIRKWKVAATANYGVVLEVVELCKSQIRAGMVIKNRSGWMWNVYRQRA